MAYLTTLMQYPEPIRKSFREQVFRLFQGQIVFAFAQWGLLVLLAWFGNNEETGNYVLALSTTAPIFLIFDLGLRVIRSTDHQHSENFRTYWAVRFYSLIGAIATLSMVVWLLFLIEFGCLWGLVFTELANLSAT